MTNWTWNGARWWKFDFHTHTPASDDYGRGSNQGPLRARSPKEWLLDYMRAGLDCVAVTDHNTGSWIDPLKVALRELESAQPKEFRPLILFPGVEISVQGGAHVLALLGPEGTTSDIDSLLGAAGFRGTKGRTDHTTERSFLDVVRAVVEAGGLAVPAHVDRPSGLFEVFSGAVLNQALGCSDIVAMEVLDSSYSKPAMYLGRGRPWTEILGSDAHHPTGNAGQHYPGSHFTWIKMGAPSLEGLRLALLDGPLSVQRSDQGTQDPNQHGPLVLETIEIEKARYMGRAEPFAVKLNPWLNAIIGGRGTGKSTLVEFLRLALRRERELQDASLGSDFEKYHKVYQSRADEGLLTEDTRFVVTYRKDHARFRIQWSPGGESNPIEEQRADESWCQAQGDVAQRFPVRLYSQKQIFQLAKAPLALLRVVDDSDEVDHRSWKEEWQQEEARFLSLRAKAREIEAGLADKPRLRGELDDVKRRLAIFEDAGHSDVLKAFQQRRRQLQGVEAWERGWAGAGERLRTLTLELAPEPLDPAVLDPSTPEDAELRRRATVVSEQLKEIGTALEELAEKADAVLAQWRQDKDASSWKHAVEVSLTAYDQLREKLAREQAGDPAAYGELVQRRQVIEQRLKELGDRRKQVDEIRVQANASLLRLLDIRRKLTRAREQFLAKVLKDNPYVRIHPLPYCAKETVEGEFRELIQREVGGFEKDIGSPNAEGLLAKIYASGDDSETIEKALAELKSDVRQIASGRSDSQALRDQRFAMHLGRLAPEALDRLDLWFPEDSLDVQYSTTGDGKSFRSIHEGSPGQKTAALLAFLLSYGEEPLILDQPEDDLDNHLIYDLIVAQLRSVKRKRQLIVVTHNANIVVNGDAELVVALGARRGETRKECEGSLQERVVREAICVVMEGGREAFDQRYRRIALEPRDV